MINRPSNRIGLKPVIVSTLFWFCALAFTMLALEAAEGNFTVVLPGIIGAIATIIWSKLRFQTKRGRFIAWLLLTLFGLFSASFLGFVLLSQLCSAESIHIVQACAGSSIDGEAFQATTFLTTIGALLGGLIYLAPESTRYFD